MTKKKTPINEDLLIKKKPTKKKEAKKPVIKKAEVKSPPKKITTENIGDLYRSDTQITEPSAKLNTLGLISSPDKYTLEIKYDGNKYSVANDKFVLLTQNYMNAIVADLETLKRSHVQMERTISKLTAEVNSLKALKSRIQPMPVVKIPFGGGKDGTN